MRRHPPHHLNPTEQATRQGRTLQRASAAPSHYSNAPNKPESQSILSKIVALMPRKLADAAERGENLDIRTVREVRGKVENFPSYT